ncbi:MAG TPA: hypothetical protein VK518_07910 [Puia sp.]|nr:hypothetical protein [Puia sp.]
MNLQAGKLSMIYENGFLRHITAGKTEVIQMIYFAIRDTEWNTIPSTITKEEITKKEDSFHITYHRLFNTDAIQMQWRVQIRGEENSTIHFEITGVALNDFQKNRIGICVLHPIKECTGNKVLVIHGDGTAEESIFPVDISPHQPFKNIVALQWNVIEDSFAILRFKGDIFETEDQRNWTDNSYKTYSTPLDLPFPTWIRKGEEVHQGVDCSLGVGRNAMPIPAIGIGRSAIRNDNYKAGLTILSTIGFSHYRVDLNLQDPEWQTTLAEGLEEAQCLKAPLELALHIPATGTVFQEFLQYAPAPRQLKSILLLEQDSPCISNQLLEKVVPLLRRQFPGVLIGGGTDSHFAELNRSEVITDDLDFVSYAIHPQVHASDDASLMENAAAQGYTVNTGKHKYATRIHVSPVTLQARNSSDARQQTEFAAAWTAVSLQSLMEAGVSSVTYFEALGVKGVASYNKEFIPFPVLRIFSDFTQLSHLK